jgi:hypothetical protein
MLRPHTLCPIHFIPVQYNPILYFFMSLYGSSLKELGCSKHPFPVHYCAQQKGSEQQVWLTHANNMTNVINYVYACHLSRYVCMIARSIDICVHICSQNPKPSSQIRAAKTNSTHGKESEGIYKQFNLQTKWQDQSTESMGTGWLVCTSTSLTSVAQVGTYSKTQYGRLITAPCNMTYELHS